MKANQRFDAYLDYLSDGLGHSDRDAGLRGYCTGLMLPLTRKSVEPMAAGLDPLHVRARHQSLHYFLAKADWSDTELLRRIRDWVIPNLGLDAVGFWIVDDTGFPRKATHSVGVAPAVLRGSGQAGQLPGGRECVAGQCCGEPAGELAALSAEGLGR